MVTVYFLILGIILVCIGSVEMIAPLRAFDFWKAWVSRQQFFLHGALLIIAGFPLTIYQGPLSTVLFIFGLLAVLAGPFVLIYPDKFRQMFLAMAEEMKDGDLKKIIYAEGLLRMAVGAVCIASYLIR
ncbi:MAG: DUF2065 family protein [Spirochaetes bacterium]|nr:DUF2065 family protein [Spirochaetota bacterium]